MFNLTVRDHIMIAHSLKGEVFGPAQKLHGATFVVDVQLRRVHLGEDGIVADIGRVQTLLREVLEPLNYRNLDEVPEFAGRNTTTEFLCGQIFDRTKARIREGALGPDGDALQSMKVTLRESHVAWASFEDGLKS
jgi:6-pyruvoyltetrahydropterin/6-carboxytetrahydropterin synthase